ncbi:pantoate--beta-alanine ligase [Moraxella catarrhalis]|uniref:Pantothenate synthetase n=1 Tax=Moraxella catarrhalis TaxID=480 RepID=A0AB36DQ43_MORCA|nr:pantoate--beta-alanine ligase [Moraxella catarrhalis]MPX29290.1 pantoate--beta-alanine ligase [Moraxella catarrhalis]OAV26789.1 Pantoate--beta-alanine ligase [Moraxella catarrhalis]RKL85989.1 pantoate--beta-alanine ligase [Moraxella catarrhalis]RKL87954.1 pantoate--beta-alanine ligase [Moraxella catarrhalis]RKL98552.1 pantoate--beta-alanine ligase [Moraxella catarrhalis]
MNIFHTIKDLKNELNPLRHQKIALVPTMGNLHDGHLSLVALAKQHADIVVVSIFVNPTQFGAGEDFASYPRTLDDDCQKLAKAGVALVFAPSVDEMYPVYPPNVQILSGSISKILCGQTRPTHFDGVGLVVSKLFNIVRPDVAVFGKKDYQQLAIIAQLVQELNFEIDIIGGEIVRADDGLALSSRNQYLTEQERAIAPRLAQALQQLAGALQSASVADFDTMIQKTKDKLTYDGFTVDYLQVLNQQLQPASRHDKHLVILTACYLGKARLLDNLDITLNPC